jgi:hypothetical protein
VGSCGVVAFELGTRGPVRSDKILVNRDILYIVCVNGGVLLNRRDCLAYIWARVGVRGPPTTRKSS